MAAGQNPDLGATQRGRVNVPRQASPADPGGQIAGETSLFGFAALLFV
jgi:hypothetical protein